jgi:hypothetical protein
VIQIEIRANKEIRRYKESIFFGLTFRQFLCSLLAVGAAVLVYFSLKDIVGEEPVSWLCILTAIPIAASGFFKYQGMTLEKFLAAWIKSEFIRAGRRLYQATNHHYTTLRGGNRDKTH